MNNLKKLKRCIKVSLSVLLLTSVIFIFSGCTSLGIDSETAWASLQNALSNSLTYDIYYHKTTSFAKDNSYNTKVNVHCDADNEGLIYNEDGSYQNFAVRIEEYKESKLNNEILCGLSNSESGDEKNVYIQKNYENGKFQDSQITEMNPHDYVKSEEFKQYTLQEKLKELSFIEYDDIDFSREDVLKFKKVGAVVHLKFALKDSYFERYKAEFGTDSVLKGDHIEIELSYDRVAKVIVYEKEKVEDSNFVVSEEVYRFELVYLGKNISIPKYDDAGMKYTWIEK